MIFYDFEVFKIDWLVVIYDVDAKEKHIIVNDAEQLRQFYEVHKNDIWCGFNSSNYDVYILKSILLGLDPKYVNDRIIRDGLKGWQISREFNKIPLNNYDVCTSRLYGLKTLEGFMGMDIKETDVPFDLDRKLTAEEIEQTIKYCTHDVEATIEVFLKKQNDFNSMMHIVKEFDLGLSHIGDTGAKITSVVLGCVRKERDDEFDVEFLPCLKIKKYKAVLDWYKHQLSTIKNDGVYSTFFTIDVAGVPHTFGFGGLHGAPSKPIHVKGAIYHVDVNNYYPSMLIAHNLVTRSATNDNYTKIYNTRKALKMKQLGAKTKAEAKHYKQMQLPYKQMLNSLSGAMKDRYNSAYDPRNNNMMCINGQLMLLDLIEHLEVIDGFQLIQSNTDGLIVKIPDTDSAFNQLDDICYDWECRMSTDRCTIELALDQISEIYQKDVNNYLWLELDGSVGERKGACVKELSELDYDLPIVNEAMVNYMAKKIPVEITINNCNELIKFQKLVKLTGKYSHVEHNGIKYTYKCYRVFASKDKSDGRIYKCGGSRGSNEKFANTPDSCFIDNGDIIDATIPSKLDKQWYIDEANKRLKQWEI
jgi:DNA polymerase